MYMYMHVICVYLCTCIVVVWLDTVLCYIHVQYVYTLYMYILQLHFAVSFLPLPLVCSLQTAKSHPQSRQRKTATAKPTKPPASRAAAKPKKVAIVASSSTESSGEKQKKTVGKKSRAAVHDIHSDEESVYSIHSASGSDIDEPPTKMAATEVHVHVYVYIVIWMCTCRTCLYCLGVLH